jgi:DNA-binding MarR family transcriptional regulator
MSQRVASRSLYTTLQAIARLREREGRNPSMREIAAERGVALNTAVRHFQLLVAAGEITPRAAPTRRSNRGYSLRGTWMEGRP